MCVIRRPQDTGNTAPVAEERLLRVPEQRVGCPVWQEATWESTFPNRLGESQQSEPGPSTLQTPLQASGQVLVVNTKPSLEARV